MKKLRIFRTNLTECWTILHRGVLTPEFLMGKVTNDFGFNHEGHEEHKEIMALLAFVFFVVRKDFA
jgi:hypothetical protein